MKHQTVGLDPKLPVQAVAAVLAWVAGYFGLDMPPEVALAAATLIGVAAGYFAPAAETRVVPEPPSKEPA